MNLAIRGIEPDLGAYAADTFLEDQHPTMRTDYIMANPHFNQKCSAEIVRSTGRKKRQPGQRCEKWSNDC